MNIERHAVCAKARGGGIALLTAALAAAGRPQHDTQSLEVGNWLRDVSQVVDPVVMNPAPACAAVNTYEAQAQAGITSALAWVERQLMDAVREAARHLERMRDFAPDSVPDLPDPEALVRGLVDSLRGALVAAVREAAEGARAAVNGLLVPDQPGGQPRLFQGAEAVLRIVGYKSHVHPERPGADPRMDIDIYEAVFDEYFTQYWPHEHLDRPPEGDFFASTPGRTMYEYLDKYLLILAGELAELDKDWATPTFHGGAGGPLAPREHALKVAQLARCMHKVEDFFAHSNFVDFAAVQDQGMARKLAISPYLTWLYALRTCEANSSDDDKRPIWPFRQQRASEGPMETLIVTGYFDFVDTLCSLAHVVEGGFGFKPSDPANRLMSQSQPLVHPVLFTREVVFELGELLHDPKTAFEDVDNKLAAHVKDAYRGLAEELLLLHEDPRAWRASLERRRTLNERVLRALLQDPQLVNGLPGKAVTWLTDALTWMASVVRVGRAAYGMYELIQDLMKLANLPVAISEAVRAAIPDFIGDTIRNAVQYRVQQILYNAVGSARVGCHSLLAKDTETSDPFAEEGILLARVAHRAVMYPLVDPGFRRSLGPDQVIDWNVYVRLLLRHPLVSPQIPGWRGNEPLWWRVPLERGQIFGASHEVGPDVLEVVPTASADDRDLLIEDAKRALHKAEQDYQPEAPPRPCRAP